MKNQKSKPTFAKVMARQGIKNIIITAIFLFVFLILNFQSFVVFAQGGTSNPTPSGSMGTTNKSSVFSLQNPLKVDSLGGLIQAFVQIFTYLVVILAVLALVYVGLRYILARGNPDEMTRLSNWLLWIVVGVAIVIGARIIVSIVINTLGASGVVDQGIIQSANNANNVR